MMYMHGFKLGRFFFAFYRGLTALGWLCALARLNLEFWSVGRVLHVKARVGPFEVDFKLL